MVSLLAQRQPIVYLGKYRPVVELCSFLDETTVTVQAREQKTFMKAGARIVMPQNSRQLRSLTVYFAVSNVLARPEWMFARSTNSQALTVFLG